MHTHCELKLISAGFLPTVAPKHFGSYYTFLHVAISTRKFLCNWNIFQLTVDTFFLSLSDVSRAWNSTFNQAIQPIAGRRVGWRGVESWAERWLPGWQVQKIPRPTTAWMVVNLVNNGISTTNFNWWPQDFWTINRILRCSSPGNFCSMSRLTNKYFFQKQNGRIRPWVFSKLLEAERRFYTLESYKKPVTRVIGVLHIYVKSGKTQPDGRRHLGQQSSSSVDRWRASSISVLSLTLVQRRMVCSRFGETTGWDSMWVVNKPLTKTTLFQ